MERSTTPRWLLLLWSCVLAPPLAWSAALGLYIVLADDACGSSRAWLLVTGAVLIPAAAAGGVVAYRTRGRTERRQGDADYGRFMLEIAVGLAALFTLVNIVSTVPIFLLSACPQ